MATILCRTRWGILPVRAAEYEVDVTTHYGVMEHFTCINYMPVWPRSLTYFHHNLVMWPGPHHEDVHILKFIDLCVFEIYSHKMQTSWPRCQATSDAMPTSLCPTSWGGGSSTCRLQTMKLIVTPSKELWCILAVYILCPFDLNLRPIITKIESRDQKVMLNIPAYFEVCSPLRFWNMRP